jgi:hypothetical protein
MRYICSLPNSPADGNPKELLSDDPVLIARFIAAEDRPGRGVYECLNPLEPGARKRSLETIAELRRIYFDLDLQHIEEDRDEAIRRLRSLPFEFTEVRDSGSGNLHLVIESKDPPPLGTPEYDQLTELWKRLAEKFAADPAPTHPAALIRCVGTHNTKNGNQGLCRQLEDDEPLRGNGKPVDMTELESLDELLSEPLLTYKEQPASADRDTEGTAERKGPVDVDARLTAMGWHGAGDSAINITQRDVMASLIAHNVSLAEATTTVLDATRKCVAGNPEAAKWDWRQEERDIAWSGARLINKNPQYAERLPDDLRTKFEELTHAGKRPFIGRNRYGLFVRPAHNGAKSDSDEEPSAEETSDDGTPDAQKEQERTQEQKHEQTKTKADPWPTPYSGRAASQIPLRSFILGQHYLVGASSVTASAGGTGKSTLSLAEAVSFAIGRNLVTGEVLDRHRRVWVWNAEDDIDEMERRVAGICAHYGINQADLDGWLFLDSGYDLPLELAHGNGKGAVVEEALIDRIAARVKEREIEVVMLDPLVALHSMAEGDNPGHAKLIRTLSTRLAKPCGCAVDINAHTRKPGPGQDSMTVDDIRGAGAIVYSARSGRILHTMSLAEAEKYNIEADDRLSYYRLERAKANMAKRGTICWVRMIEVPIANRSDGSYGDTIAVPTIWTPPDAMEGITDTIANAIAGEIAKGEYKRDTRAGASWAGRLVGLRCGIDTGTRSGKDRAKAILETLIKKGVLAVEIRTDKNRNSREYVVPGALHATR